MLWHNFVSVISFENDIGIMLTIYLVFCMRAICPNRQLVRIIRCIRQTTNVHLVKIIDALRRLALRLADERAGNSKPARAR